jgi:cyclopropane fatty-acyl-phospholipid synthase-like methyltransferase
LEWLDLSPGKTLLDVACGAGGPALRIAAATGCSVVGIDVHEQAVTTASSLAAQRGLAERAEFWLTDATGPLPFSDASFDAITCIDAINHFSDRPHVVAEWVRVLKAGGRLLFTDPITLTGPVTNEEVAVRSSAGIYLFVPHGYDESVIAQCGLRLLVCEDVTANMAKSPRRDALPEHRKELLFAKSKAIRYMTASRSFSRSLLVLLEKAAFLVSSIFRRGWVEVSKLG